MRYDEAQKKIKKTIKSMAGKYNTYSIFRDFIVLSACAISNCVDKVNFEKREKMYLDTINKYTRKEADKFTEMFAFMVEAYESKMSDFIGELYMSMDFGNRDAGQFFTPYNISKLMAGLLDVRPDEYGKITLNEPAVGSGGMIVAYAERLLLEKYNYQKQLRVICNDIDYDVVKMCYIQLSILGIDAVVLQGDSITQKFNEIWYTPMHMMNIAREAERQERDEKTNKMLMAMKQLIDLEKEKEETDKEKEPQLIGPPGQMNIFDFID